MDEGATGISIGDDKQRAFLGAAPAKHWTTGLPDPFIGLVVKEPGGAVQTYGATRKP